MIYVDIIHSILILIVLIIIFYKLTKLAEEVNEAKFVYIANVNKILKFIEEIKRDINYIETIDKRISSSYNYVSGIYGEISKIKKDIDIIYKIDKKVSDQSDVIGKIYNRVCSVYNSKNDLINDLNIIHQNIHGLKSTIDDTKEIINSYSEKINIIPEINQDVYNNFTKLCEVKKCVVDNINSHNVIVDRLLSNILALNGSINNLNTYVKKLSFKAIKRNKKLKTASIRNADNSSSNNTAHSVNKD